MAMEKRVTIRINEEELKMLEELRGHWDRRGVNGLSDSMLIRSAIHQSYFKAVKEDTEMEDIRKIKG